jgi:predicted nucleotide-binding protein
MAKQQKQENLPQDKDKRKYVNQSQVPVYSLEEALKVPTAILENFGGRPTAPFQVAMAIESTQTSSYWRKLSGSAVAYGLTDGGYNSTKIGLTELALQILAPTEEGIDKIGLVEASLKPSVLRRFFDKYNNAKFPKDTIAENVLKLDFNVPSEDSARILDIIKSNGRYTGIIHETKTGPYVFADEPADVSVDTNNNNVLATDIEIAKPEESHEHDELPAELAQKMNLKRAEKQSDTTPLVKNEKPKVFISHGKNKKIVEQLKEILTFGQFDVIVSVEKESTAISVPDKVFSDMRDSDAAVIHVEGERELLDKGGNVHHIINENVLIEIGAAIALYGKKFIILSEHTVKLPSNLQGLYRCNYEGKELSYEATMKLLKAFNEFRTS